MIYIFTFSVYSLYLIFASELSDFLYLIYTVAVNSI